MYNSADLESLIGKLPPELQECIDQEAIPNLSDEEKEDFVRNVEYLLATEKKSNKSVSIRIKHNPVPDAAVGFGSVVGFYVPVHEGLHMLMSKACGGTVYGITYESNSFAVMSHEPTTAAQLATGTAPYLILTPIGLYFIKQGIKEKSSSKVMFGAMNTFGTLQEAFPINGDFARVAAIISNYAHTIPDGAIKAGLIAGVFAFSYGVVKLADYTKVSLKTRKSTKKHGC